MTALLALLLLTAEPAPPPAQAETNDVIDTAWSLDKPRANRPQRARNAQSAGTVRPTRRQATPRVFGGARMTNSGRRKKGGANVGVAVPF